MVYSSWRYRARIDVVNSTSISDYQINVVVPYRVHMNSDFSDIRFSDVDGNELSYWIESSISLISVNVWVKCPANCDSFYLYYGNSIVDSESSGSNTFDFIDEFTRADNSSVGNGWSESALGNGSISNNQLLIGLDTKVYRLYDARNKILTVKTSYNYQNTSVREVRLGGVGGTAYQTGLCAVMRSDTDGPSTVKIYDNEVTKASASFTFITNQMYYFEFTMLSDYSTELRVWQTDTDRPSAATISAAALTPADSTQNLFISTNTQAGSTHYFDNFYIRKYISPSPIATVFETIINPFHKRVYTSLPIATLIKTYLIDSLFKKLNIDKNYTIDAIISRLNADQNYIINTLIKQLNIDQNYTIDNLLKQLNIEHNYTLDALLKDLNIDYNYTVDVLLIKLTSKNLNIDTFITALNINQNYNIDIVLQELNIDQNYMIDAILKLIKDKEYIIDILFKKSNIDKTYLIDALCKKLNIDKEYIFDTLLSELNIDETYLIDAILSTIGTIDKTYVINIILKAEDTDKEYVIDVLLEKLNINKLFSIDVLLGKLNINKSQLIDVLLKAKDINNNYIINVKLSVPSISDKQYITDILLQGTINKNYTIDTLLKLLNVDSNFYIDCIFAKIVTFKPTVRGNRIKVLAQATPIKIRSNINISDKIDLKGKED